LSALQESLSTITSLGYQLVTVNPDEFAKNKEFTTKKDYGFEFYSDKDLNLINAFGIGTRMKDGKNTLPIPAIYIIKEGVIQFQYVNPKYSYRLKTESLMSILAGL